MPEFVLAEFVGRILYGIFTLVIVIVLLNMLIAMITNSFQKIEVRHRSLRSFAMRHPHWMTQCIQCGQAGNSLSAEAFLLHPLSGRCGCRVEVCQIQTVSQLLQGRTHHACALQHHPLTQSCLLHLKVRSGNKPPQTPELYPPIVIHYFQFCSRAIFRQFCCCCTCYPGDKYPPIATMVSVF